MTQLIAYDIGTSKLICDMRLPKQILQWILILDKRGRPRKSLTELISEISKRDLEQTQWKNMTSKSIVQWT